MRAIRLTATALLLAALTTLGASSAQAAPSSDGWNWSNKSAQMSQGWNW